MNQVLFSVPCDVRSAPADRIVAESLAVLGRHGGEQHEERRDADVVERIVARLMRPLALELLAGHGVDHTGAIFLRLIHQRDIDVLGSPTAARGVAVHLCDAVLVQIDGEVIGEPGTAGIPAGGMTRPPRDAHRSLESIAVFPQHARHFQHARIADGVVANAKVPRVIVPVQQHERFRFVGARNRDHRNG